MPLAPSYLPRGRYQLTPEDEEGIARRAVNAGLSGLGMVGNALDLPGSMVRDILAGENPLDQWLSPLSDTNRVTGRDLLSQYGLLDKNKETGISGWWDDPMEGVRDLAGFGADVALDPLTYLTFGAVAVGKGGAALKAAGLMDDVGSIAAKAAGSPLGSIGPRRAGMTTKVGDVLAAATPEARKTADVWATEHGFDLADYLDEPTRGLFGVKLPFAKTPVGTFGKGKSAQKAADLLDAYSPNIFGGEFGRDIPFIGSQQPLGAWAKSVFHAPSMGRAIPLVQEHAQRYFADEAKAAAEAKTLAADWTLRGERSGVYDPRVTRRAAEGVGVDPTGLGHEMGDLMETLPERDRAAGYKSGRFDDEHIDFAPRHAAADSTIAAKGEPIGGHPSGPMSTSAQAKPRQDIFRGFPGGGEQVNDLVSDKELHDIMEAGIAAGKKPADVKKDMTGLLRKKYGMPGDPDALDPTIPKTTKEGKTYHFKDATGKPFELDAEKVAAGAWNKGRTKWTGYGPGGTTLGTWDAQTVDHFEQLANYVHKNPQLKTEGLYTRDPLLEGADRAKATFNRETAGRNAIAFANDEQLWQNELHAAGKSGEIGETIKLSDFFKRVGMDADLGAQAWWAKAQGVALPQSPESVLKALSAGHITAAQATTLLDAAKKFSDDANIGIKDMKISKSMADDYLKPTWNPSLKGTPLEGVVSKIDSFTNLFKAGVLSWPSTKVRDLASGQIENLLRGMLSASSVSDAKKLMTGGTIEGLSAKAPIAELLKRANIPVTDEAATDLMRSLYAGHSGGSIQATAGDITQQAGPVYGQGRPELLDVIPGMKGKGRPVGGAAADVAAEILDGTFTTKLKPGSVVQASDRQNFGKIVSMNDKTATVSFVNPQTQQTAQVKLRLDQLTPARSEKTTWNPLKSSIRGVGGATKSTFAPVSFMEGIGNTTDMANRLVPFMDLVKSGVDPAEAMRRINSAQVDYCVDTETDILTESGWKTWNSLCVGDRVLTLDMADGGIGWQPVSAVNIFENKWRTLHSWEGRGFSAMTTNAHRWLCRGGRYVKVAQLADTGIRADDTYSRGTVRSPGWRWLASEHIHEHAARLILGGGEYRGPVETVADQIVELCGWYMTEGNNHGKCGFSVSQSMVHGPQYVERIRNLKSYFAAQGSTATEWTAHDNGWGLIAAFYFGKGIGNTLRYELCPNKVLSMPFLLRLSRRQLELLYKTIMDGDAERRCLSRKNGRVGGRVSQKRKDITDSIQIVVSLLGRRSRVSQRSDDMHRLSVYSSTFLETVRLRKTLVETQGIVWCPTTPTGTWMARRNGCVYWTGNSPRTFTAAESALKRVLPFYSYLSRKGIDVGKHLAEAPGGPTSHAIQAIGAARDRESILPDYISDTAAIPMQAKVNDGTKRFLTGLGLMFESPLSMIGTPRSTGLELLSQMNPLIKGPLEHFTGQTFFQKGPEGGRPLEDLDPTIGRILSNITELSTGEKQRQAVKLPSIMEEIIGNSPLSRVATTARQLTDTRKDAKDKALALLTGVRVSDISPAAQESQLREAVSRMERELGGKTFTKSYIPADVKAKMSPEELMNALRLEALMNTLNKRQKERIKKEKANAR